MSGFGMALDLRYPFGGDAFPKNFARAFVQRVNLPGMFGIVFYGSNVAIESETRFVFRCGGDGRAYENHVAPDHGTGMSEARHLRFPNQVLSLFNVPGLRRGLALNHAGSARPTELRPVLGLRG